MFDPAPSARADLTPGTLYAATGESDWIYYGQVMTDRRIGFFRRRDREVGNSDEILASPVMAQVAVVHPSIGRALRNGRWKKIGRFPVVPALAPPAGFVIWSVGTLTVAVSDGPREWDTRVEDPAIQTLEIAAVWDAEVHLPERLTADFEPDRAEWHVGGPVWRQRRVREEYARRFPDSPWHQLPEDWVPTGA